MEDKKTEPKTPEHIRFRLHNLIMLGSLVIVFVLFLILNSSLGVTASRMPRVVGWFGLALCAIEAWRQLRGFKSRPAESSESFDKVEGRPAWVILLMMVAYLPALYVFGFLISTIAFMFVSPFILGRKKLLGNAVYAIIGGVSMWACFVKVFSLRLPSGWLFTLIK